MPPQFRSIRSLFRAYKPLPKNLPRKRVVHELPADQLACPWCRQARTRIGEEISEQLEYDPGSFYVIEHVRPTYACKNCEAHLITADKPLQPIDKGLRGPGVGVRRRSSPRAHRF